MTQYWPYFWWKKLFSFYLADVLKIRHKNVQYSSLVHADKPKFGLFLPLAFQISFLPVSFRFSRPVYSRYILRAIFFLAAVKRLGVKYGQSLEVRPWLTNCWYAGLFYHHLCNKTNIVFFKLDMSQCPRYPKTTVALLSAYQECLVTFRLMTWQVVQRARPLSSHIWEFMATCESTGSFLQLHSNKRRG